MVLKKNIIMLIQKIIEKYMKSYINVKLIQLNIPIVLNKLLF